MFKKSLVALAVSSSISGCSMLADVAEYAASANDEALKSSEFLICRGGSVGAIMRRYNTPDLREAWRKMCLNTSADIPFIEGDN